MYYSAHRTHDNSGSTFSVVLLKNASSDSEINKKIRLWNSHCAIQTWKQKKIFYVEGLATNSNCISRDITETNNYILMVNVLTKYTTQACNSSFFFLVWAGIRQVNIGFRITRARSKGRIKGSRTDLAAFLEKERSTFANFHMCKESVHECL